MADLNFKTNAIYHMDNLDALRGMNSGTVDLIATDPPFNTGRNREAVGGKYVDQWRFNDNVHPEWMDSIRDDNRALVEVIESAMHAHSDNLGAFLCFLGIRLIEMKRVLKDTGSIYLHCDPTAGHYIKASMDAVFGAKNFQREIVWHLRGASGYKALANDWVRGHDTIFFYSMSLNRTFNKVWLPYDENQLKRFCSIDEHGRRYKSITKDRRLYLDDAKGVPATTVWSDISGFQTIVNSKERTGYPDQKPVKLYERIIKASSNEDDLVLDPFAGCGTTVVAARNLGRRWVGIDRSDMAREMILCNLAGMKKKDVEEAREKTKAYDPNWIDRVLRKHGAAFEDEPPVRTDADDGDLTPELATVFGPAKEPVLWTHDEMRLKLFRHYRGKCWGCDFVAPKGTGKDGLPRGLGYLELDHVTPKSDGGTNNLDNRALLCGPCNRKKGNRLTLSGLRRQLKKNGEPLSTVPLDKATAWCREEHRKAYEKKVDGLQPNLG